jgi:EAL domain-containing protein (putative c-di-GMP-specific phosphodiesterase class I)
MTATTEIAACRTSFERGWTLAEHGEHLESPRLFPLRTFPCRVGRQSSANIRLLHPTVSGLHAEIGRVGQQLHVRDLGSRNGTFVNGMRADQWMPFHEGDLLQLGTIVFRLTVEQPAATPQATFASNDVNDLALALAQFDKLMDEKAYMAYFQPIVFIEDGALYAYEALGRSRLFGLNQPAIMFKAAAYFNMEAELSRQLRNEGIAGMSAREETHLFLNTHPTELTDLPQLITSLRVLRKAYPDPAITLEIHESAAVDMTNMRLLRLALNDLRMGLAFDDFGAGQARLAELTETRPDFLKFDMRLIRNIHKSPERMDLAGTLVKIARGLSIATIAEGIETADEAAACRQIGFELAQGFYYGRPATAQTYCSQKAEPAVPAAT